MNTRIIGLLMAFLISITPLIAAKRGTPHEPAISTDSTVAVRTVQNFLRWYKANIGATSRIILVNQNPGKPYSVNIKNTEQYLATLRSSHLLTDTFLNEWRTFFKERQTGFQATPQREGPPTGFDYDLVMLSQEVDMQLDSLKTLKIKSVKLKQNKAAVKFFLLADYEFRLVQQNNRWLINEILNLSAE
ncbi:hypothetical protein [Spirosoma flavum]|uniref:DUF3828 domain-containing protein n=1 Tax=Spirosoma flavum TaxID=2048557 RepID=A0ABW6ARP6_9BACT